MKRAFGVSRDFATRVWDALADVMEPATADEVWTAFTLDQRNCGRGTPKTIARALRHLQSGGFVACYDPPGARGPLYIPVVRPAGSIARRQSMGISATSGKTA